MQCSNEVTIKSMILLDELAIYIVIGFMLIYFSYARGIFTLCKIDHQWFGLVIAELFWIKKIMDSWSNKSYRSYIPEKVLRMLTMTPCEQNNPTPKLKLDMDPILFLFLICKTIQLCITNMVSFMDLLHQNMDSDQTRPPRSGIPTLSVGD